MKDNLIVIACSTGGPKALQKIIPLLPKDIDCPILIVQHMPAGFTKSLAERLDSLSEIHVLEADENLTLQKGCAYLAKGGFQMLIKKAPLGKHIIKLNDKPAKNGLRPCADELFKSLVRTDYKTVTIAVLTGMGDDSLEGIKILSEHKNLYIITQDKETSTVYGMPKSIYEAGLADKIVPLHKMAEVITKNVEVH
ncbi:MAG: CheB methylesterase domain-containing protein [bacterium]|nr:CheB methylesterase domain-containing protein [bacterium]